MFMESLAYNARTKNSRLFRSSHRAADGVLRKKLEDIATEMERLDELVRTNVVTSKDRMLKDAALSNQASEIQAELYRRMVTCTDELM